MDNFQCAATWESHYKGVQVWTSVCRKTEQKRLQNSFKRVDQLRWPYIRRELIPGGGACYGEWPNAEVGGSWTSDQVAAGGRAQPLSASDWRDCWHKSARYIVASPCSALNVSRHSLNWTHCGTGSQWRRSSRTRLMWSCLSEPTNSRAAVFRTPKIKLGSLRELR